MAKINFGQPKAMFFSVLADGKFHHGVEEGTEGAVLRKWELKDGTKGQKWEITAQDIAGKISNLSISEGDYGDQLHIAFAGEKEGDRTVVVSLSLSSNFAEDFLKKLPNINIDEEVKLAPYAFEDENKKLKKGITVYQGKEKIKGAYHEMKKVGKTEKLVTKNGYPEIPKEATNWKTDDWKIYYLSARKFLVKQLEKHPLFNLAYLKAAEEEARADKEFKENYPDSPNLKDIPF